MKKKSKFFLPLAASILCIVSSCSPKESSGKNGHSLGQNGGGGGGEDSTKKEKKKKPPKEKLDPFKAEIKLGKTLVDDLKTASGGSDAKKAIAKNNALALLKGDDAPFAILWADEKRETLKEWAEKLGIGHEFDEVVKKLHIEGELAKKGIGSFGFTCYMNSALQVMLLSNTVLDELNKRLKDDTLYNSIGYIGEDKYNAKKNFLRGIVKFSMEARTTTTNAKRLKSIAGSIYESAVNAKHLEEGRQSDSSEFFYIITGLLNIHPITTVVSRELFDKDKKSIGIRDPMHANESMLLLNMEKKDTTIEELLKNYSAKNTEDRVDYQLVIEEKAEFKNPKYGLEKDERKYVDDNYSHYFEYQYHIEDLPNELLINLSRFKYDGSPSKIDNKVIIPGEIISLQDIIAPHMKDANKKYEYRIKAISIHSGNIGGGHYLAYCRYGDDWYAFDDSSVSEISFDDVKKESEEGAYFYLLERIIK